MQLLQQVFKRQKTFRGWKPYGRTTKRPYIEHHIITQINDEKNGLCLKMKIKTK